MLPTSVGSSASSAGSAWDEVTAGAGAADEDGAAAEDGVALTIVVGGDDAVAGDATAAFEGDEAPLPHPARTRITAALTASGASVRLATLRLGIGFIRITPFGGFR
jgi:CubicO group peptidase (beta-lactamase class C family)